MVFGGAHKPISSRLIYAAVLAALCLWLGYSLVRAAVVWATPSVVWMPPTQAMSTQSVTPIAVGGASPQRRYDFQTDPFYPDVQTPTTPAAVVGADAPETTLNLTLMGRRTGADGTAILVTPDRREAVYRVGDEIIDGVILKSVTEDFIVLSQNGQIERLSFVGNEPTGLAQVSIETEEGANARVAPSSITIDRLLSSVTLTRVDRDGQRLGFRVSSSSADVRLTDFGLKDGDVLTRIGAETLTQGRPEFAVIARELSGASNFDIELLRDGAVMTINIGL